MTFRPAIPVLRVFDQAKAEEFYGGLLGFTEDWRYQHQPDLPVYLQVSRSNCVLHLTEHHGDCCPGAAVRVEVDDVDAYHAELRSQNHRHARPEIADTPWGTREFWVTDPFGNRLTFTSPPPTDKREQLGAAPDGYSGS